jgi:hypothetical protein
MKGSSLNKSRIPRDSPSESVEAPPSRSLSEKMAEKKRRRGFHGFIFFLMATVRAAAAVKPRINNGTVVPDVVLAGIKVSAGMI